MFIDHQALLPEAEMAADVCIVGCGPAGLVLALCLRNSGLDILILESGHAGPADEPQLLGKGLSTGIHYPPLESTRYRGFGGSSALWGTHPGDFDKGSLLARALDREDFEPREWVPDSGWPVDAEALSTYFRFADEFLGTGASDFPIGSETDSDDNGLRLADDTLVDTEFRIGNAVRLHHDHRKALEEAQDIRLITDSTVIELHGNDSGSHVDRVIIRHGDGRTRAVRAQRFVLACGGIENPRLLLAARGRRGIGNEHDLVGRYFMEHPHGTTGVFVPASPEIEQRLAPYQIQKDNQSVRTRKHLAIAEPLLRRERLLRYAANLWPAEAEPDWMPDDLVNVAARYVAGLDRPVRIHAISWMSEQAPNPQSRVTLADELGPDGVPLPCLDWQLSELDIRTMIRGQQIVQEEIHIARLGTVFTRQHRDAHGGFLAPLWGGYEATIDVAHHHMGTTRMHEDATRGVVNADCRVHGCNNLYIAGSSVFPTSGHANATLTIVALAARLAEHLAATR